VVTLLAILELAREGLVDVTQQEAYSPIYVRLTGDGNELEAA
jgi:segregation and condensation protein A